MRNLKGFLWRGLSLAASILEAILTFSASPVSAQGAPEEVAKALIAAEDAHNVEAAVAYFADDAVVRHEGGSAYTTPEAVREWQQGLADGHFRIEAVNFQVEGSSVSWTGTCSLDRFRSLGIAAMGSIWKVTIEGDKIKTFDFAFTPESLVELRAGITAATLISAEAAHDVSTACAQFADDAVVRHEGGSAYTTPEAIRAWQQGLADGNFHFEPVGLAVEGEIVTWTGTVSLDSFRGLGIAALGGIWKLAIVDGKIKTFDYSWTPQAAQTLQKAIQAHAKP